MGLLPKDRDLTEPPEEVELVVDASDFRVKAAQLSMRLDQFLGERLHWRSRASIQKLVRDGYVFVDASTPDHPQGTGERLRETRPGRRLRHGSRVVVVIPEELRMPSARATSSLAVLYEDEEVIAVDKPPHVTVHPAGRHMTDTLIQRVHARYKSDVEAGRLVPRLCHRLDRETSGIVLVSKNPRTHARLMRQFERRRVEKSYLAIVWGVPEEDGGSIRLPVGPSRTSAIRLKMAVDVDGLDSRTDWVVRERAREHALLHCDLYTGRQHQIRVHLAAIGHPVVGDKLYGPDEMLFAKAQGEGLDQRDLRRLELDRHALHHHRLVFVTPAGGERVEVTSPLAPDLRAFMDQRRI